MYKLKKILLSIALTVFIIQAQVISISPEPAENKALIYWYLLIVLLLIPLPIDLLKKDFSLDYFRQNYKNPFLLALWLIGLLIGGGVIGFQNIFSVSFLIWIYFLTSIIYSVESRIAGLAAGLLFGYTIALSLMHHNAIAGQMATYVFYFLIILAATQAREYHLTEKEIAE